MSNPLTARRRDRWRSRLAVIALIVVLPPCRVFSQLLPHSTIPVVVLVHGRGQSGSSIDEVRNRFTGAFRDAQVARFGIQIVPDSDVGFVWYADVLDPTSQRPPGAVQCMHAMSVTNPSQGWIDGLRSALIDFAASVHLDKPLIKTFMADTYDYLSSPTARCEANTRVAVALEIDYRGRPVVLVAHSMGGIVSFSALAENSRTLNPQDRVHITRFVTIATQIGVRQVLSGLDGSYTSLPVPEPITIDSWRNFRNEGDLLAFDTGPAFDATDKMREPRDIVIHEHGDPHAATTYLANAQVLQSILWSWCRSYPPAPSKPVQCAQVAQAADP